MQNFILSEIIKLRKTEFLQKGTNSNNPKKRA